MSDPRADHTTADVLYASDLHGHQGLYRELTETAWRLRVRAIVLGGDLAPHAEVAAQRRFYAEFLVPLVREYIAKPGSADLFYIPGNDDWKASLSVIPDRTSWSRVHGGEFPVHPPFPARLPARPSWFCANRR